MKRTAEVARKTKETDIKISLVIDGKGRTDIDSGIPFFDHMLTLLAVHGFFDLTLHAAGDLDVDYHHTIEDVGLVFGDAIQQALGLVGPLPPPNGGMAMQLRPWMTLWPL